MKCDRVVVARGEKNVRVQEREQSLRVSFDTQAMTRRFPSRQLTQLRRKNLHHPPPPPVVIATKIVASRVSDRHGAYRQSHIRDFYVNYPVVLHRDRSLCPDVIKRRYIHVYRLYQKL